MTPGGGARAPVLEQRGRPVGATGGALTPLVYRVASRRRETADVTTLTLVPVSARLDPFRPGQFDMLTAFGVGEVAVSVSGDPDRVGPGDRYGSREYTVRAVGAVSRHLCSAAVGDPVGLRGPFGHGWDDEQTAAGDDAVVVAGGIGLAPLRSAVYRLIRRRRVAGGRVTVLVGARRPDQVIFGGDMARWSAAGAAVEVTVDAGDPSWTGRVGLVTDLLPGGGIDASRSDAFVCGPEAMMRATARALIGIGVAPDRIRLSLERNMQCGIGWCGHCQLGPHLLCRDGPVLPYPAVSGLLAEAEV